MWKSKQKIPQVTHNFKDPNLRKICPLSLHIISKISWIMKWNYEMGRRRSISLMK